MKQPNSYFLENARLKVLVIVCIYVIHAVIHAEEIIGIATPCGQRWLVTGVRHQHNDSIESILRNEALYLITTISPERHFVRLLHSASTDNYPFNNSEEFKREQLSTWLRRKQESSTQNDSHKRPTTLFESILSFGSAETPPMPERYLYGALLNDKWRIHGSDKRFHESRPFRRRSVGEAGRMDLRVRRETVYEGSGVSYDKTCKAYNPCIKGTCHDALGGFTCSCSTGMFLLNDGITCEPLVKKFAMNIVLDMEARSELQNKSSVYYNHLLDEVKLSLFLFYDKTIGDAFINVSDVQLSPGSVAAEHTVEIIRQMTGEEESLMSRCVVQLLNDHVLQVNNIIYDVKSVTIDNLIVTSQMSACAVLTVLAPCPPGYACRLNSTTDLPLCQRIQYDGNYKLIIGLGIGIPLSVITFIIVSTSIYLCLRSHKMQSAIISQHNVPEGRDVASRKGFTKSGSWFAKPRFHPHEACSHQRASRSSTQGIDAAQMEEIQQEHSFVKDPKLITGRDEPVATQG